MVFPSRPNSLWCFSLPRCSRFLHVLFSRSTCFSASDSLFFLLKKSFESSWFQLLCHIWLWNPWTLQGIQIPGEFIPTNEVSAKRAEKQQDCTKCLIRAILETALNEIKLLGLDPSQCNPWGADTAICTLIYWALELFNIWFMVVNCLLANVHCAKLSVPSPIKNQGLIHVKSSWWVHYVLGQASGSQDWQIISHFCPIFLIKFRRSSSIFHQCFYVYFWENPHSGSGCCDIERMTHSDIQIFQRISAWGWHLPLRISAQMAGVWQRWKELKIDLCNGKWCRTLIIGGCYQIPHMIKLHNKKHKGSIEGGFFPLCLRIYDLSLLWLERVSELALIFAWSSRNYIKTRQLKPSLSLSTVLNNVYLRSISPSQTVRRIQDCNSSSLHWGVTSRLKKLCGWDLSS